MSHNNIKKVPYCKVCQDAGKLESEYRSHWVKDLKGNTICPTLLNTECRYCYKLGHTAKFCSVLEKNNKEKYREERRYEKEKPKQQYIPKQKNGYAALQEDSDVEEEIKVSIKPNVVVEEYPSLGRNKTEDTQHQVKSGWAAIAAKPKEEKPVDPIPTGMTVLTAKNRIKPILKPENKPKQIKSWADWSDTDSEEEDECLYDNQTPADLLEDW